MRLKAAEEEGEADEEEEEQLKEEERLGTVLFRGRFTVALLSYRCFPVAFFVAHYSFEFQRLEKTISLMILCLAYIFSPVFYTAIVTDYYDLVRGTELSSQSSSSSFGLRVSLSSAPSYGRFLGFLGRFGAPLSSFLPLSPMLLFAPSPVFSSHRGLSLVSLHSSADRDHYLLSSLVTQPIRRHLPESLGHVPKSARR